MTAPTVARTNPTGVVNRVQVSLSGTYTAATDTYTSADGSVVLDGSGNLVIKPGFAPTYVKAINATSRITLEWYYGMAAGFYLLTVAAGTRTYVNTSSALAVSVASTGSAPVTVEGVNTVTLVAGAALAFNDNTDSVVIIEG